MSQQELSPGFKEMLRMVREYRENPYELTPPQALAMRIMEGLSDIYTRWYDNLGAEEEELERRNRAALSYAFPNIFNPPTPTSRNQSEEVQVEEDDEVTPPVLEVAPGAPRRRRRTTRINRALLRPTRLDFSDSSPVRSSTTDELEDSINFASEGTPRRSRGVSRINRHTIDPISFGFSPEVPSQASSEDSSVSSPEDVPTTPRRHSLTRILPRRNTRRSLRSLFRYHHEDSDSGISTDNSPVDDSSPQETPRRRPMLERFSRRKLDFEYTDISTSKPAEAHEESRGQKEQHQQ